MADRAWPRLPAAWDGPSEGTVDCVRVCVDRLTPEVLVRLRSNVPSDEATRIDRNARRADRVRALVGRAVLRILLARAAGGSEPRSVPIETPPPGKPGLPGGPEFNLSHGGNVVLFGFSRALPVGVDVEPVASAEAWREVVARLHPIERSAIGAAADPAAAFIRLWTRKEAVAKAAGVGLSVDPDRWAVSADRPEVVVPLPGTGGVADWSVFDVVPARGHAGAVAVMGRVACRCWTIEPG